MPTNMPAKPVMPSRPAPMASPKGKKASIVGLLGLLVGLVAGYGAGRVSTGTPLNPLTGQGGSYQQGYDAARKKIEDAHLFPPSPTEMTSMNGTVKSVGTDSLVAEVALNSSNPLDQINAPAERTVTITKDTKIMRQTAKTSAETQKDLEAFQKASANGTIPVPPTPYKLEEISLTDIKAGDSVTLSADHDILHAANFTAVEIDLLPAAAAAAPSPAPSPAPAPGTPPSGTTGPTGQAPSGSTAGPTGAPPTGAP